MAYEGERRASPVDARQSRAGTLANAGRRRQGPKPSASVRGMERSPSRAVRVQRLATASALAALVAAAPGCGRRQAHSGSDLQFETLSDTSGLSQGPPLLVTFEPYRMANGVMRVRGEMNLPEGTRIQISIFRARDGGLINRLQMPVLNRRFDSPPLIGPRGPLPVDDYRFEVLAHFNEAWQPPEVLTETDGGRSLRGPGVVRGAQNTPAILLTREKRL